MRTTLLGGLVLLAACGGRPDDTGAGTGTTGTGGTAQDGDGDGFFDGVSDCDDRDPAVNPLATELCDGIDNDCDAVTDEGGASDATEWHPDVDGDGYGDRYASTRACETPPGHTLEGTDCLDSNAQVNPEGVEVCDGLDNDCDFVVDPPWLQTSFEDAEVSRLSWNLDAANVVDSGTGGGVARLTEAKQGQIGTLFFNERVRADAFHVGFDLHIEGSTAGEGIAFGFLEETSPTSAGGYGEALGIEGLAGYAVEFDTRPNGGSDGLGEHITVYRTVSGEGISEVFYGPTTLGGSLRNAGAVHVDILLEGLDLEVWVGGSRLVSTTLAGFSLEDVLVGFGATTDIGSEDSHIVDNLVIGCPSTFTP